MRTSSDRKIGLNRVLRDVLHRVSFAALHRGRRLSALPVGFGLEAKINFFVANPD